MMQANTAQEASDLLKEYLSEMHREGRVAYFDEDSRREFRRVDEIFIEMTTRNSHLFPEAVVWIPVKATDADDVRHDQ